MERSGERKKSERKFRKTSCQRDKTNLVETKNRERNGGEDRSNFEGSHEGGE